jgi:hypothetical protein
MKTLTCLAMLFLALATLAQDLSDTEAVDDAVSPVT